MVHAAFYTDKSSGEYLSQADGARGGRASADTT